MSATKIELERYAGLSTLDNPAEWSLRAVGEHGTIFLRNTKTGEERAFMRDDALDTETDPRRLTFES
jgi:hypothetical protein